MRKKLLLSFILACFFSIGASAASAELYENMYYTVENGEVTITDSVQVFYESTITIPSSIDGYPVTAIGKRAFDGYLFLLGVEIPDTVVSIEENAFSNCDELTSITIPDGVKTIGKSAFYSCDDLKNVYISKSVETIEKNAFGSCGKLATINVDANNSNYSSADGVLYNKQKTTLIQFPSNKASYSIPETVTTIGEEAFASSIVSYVKLPAKLKTISSGAFSGCNNLTEIDIPDSVDTIGDAVFSNCTALCKVNLPEALTAISQQMFSNCSSLTKIDIPENVAQIGVMSFYECRNLTAINVDSANPVYMSLDGVLYSKDKTVLVKYPSAKTNVTFPDTVIEFADYSFENCTGVSEVILNDGFVKIGDLAFVGCTNLKEVTIPTSVTYIGVNAFRQCTNLTDIYYLGKESQWNRINFSGSKKLLTDATIHYSGSAHFEVNYVERSTRTNCKYSIDVDNSRKGIFIIAAFDKNNRFLGCDTKVMTTADTQITGEIVLKKTPERYRAFAWDGFTNADPISNLVKGTIY